MDMIFMLYSGTIPDIDGDLAREYLLLLYWEFCLLIHSTSPGIILCMRSANERRRYIVTSSLIGRVYTQNDPW